MRLKLPTKGVHAQELHTHGTVTDCFKAVREKTGIAFAETLFYGGETSSHWLGCIFCHSCMCVHKAILSCSALVEDIASVRTAKALGMTCVQPRYGISCDALQSGCV